MHKNKSQYVKIVMCVCTLKQPEWNCIMADEVDRPVTESKILRYLRWSRDNEARMLIEYVIYEHGCVILEMSPMNDNYM